MTTARRRDFDVVVVGQVARDLVLRVDGLPDAGTSAVALVGVVGDDLGRGCARASSRADRQRPGGHASRWAVSSSTACTNACGRFPRN